MGMCEMIKDKIIQKKIKGKVLAVAMTAVMASLFVPVRVDAADSRYATKEETECFHNPGDTFTSNLILQENPNQGWKWENGSADANCYDSKTGLCKGHKISGNRNYSIIVEGGNHRIVLDGASITPIGTGDDVYSPIHIKKGNVTLVVEGTSSKPNKLTGPESRAGIYVAPGANLTIKSTNDDNQLLVKGGQSAAGIGGHGGGNSASSGYITIDSGTIVAEGGNRGAGIGGSGRGTTQGVTINGGNIIAKGGDGIIDPQLATDPNSKLSFGAPGIGDGNDDRITGGTITVNGGNITAIGGTHYSDDPNNKKENAAGLSVDTLTSKEGRTVIISDRLNIRKSNDFSGLQWNLDRAVDGTLLGANGTPIDVKDFTNSILTNNAKRGKTCTAYGTAEVPSDFVLDSDEELIVPQRTTLRVPNPVPIKGYVQIMDNTTVVNPENLVETGDKANVTYGDNIEYKVSFNPAYDLIMKSQEKDQNGIPVFPYTGAEYVTNPIENNDIFSLNRIRKGVFYDGGYHDCDVDIDSSMSCTYEKTDDSNVKEVKNAGSYKVVFSYGNPKPEQSFKIAQHDITKGEGIAVSGIPVKEYRGKPFEEDDFAQVNITFNGHPVEKEDYQLQPEQRTDAGTAKLTINGFRNFTGKYEKETFTISAVKLTDKNTDLWLKSGTLNWDSTADGNNEQSWNVAYNAKGQEPVVDRGLVHANEDVNLSGFDSKWERITEEGTGCTDAGTIKVTVTPKKDNVNFEGSCSREFIIHPIILKASTVTPAYTERAYDSTDKVSIKAITVDLALNGDNWNKMQSTDYDLVRVPTAEEIAEMKMSGSLDSADVGIHETVTLGEDARLAGDKGINYTIAGTYAYSSGEMTDTVEIKQAPAPGFSVVTKAEPDVVPLNFNCILTFTANPESVFEEGQRVYYYRSEGEDDKPTKEDEWLQGNLNELNELVCGSIGPNSEVLIYVYTAGTPNVMEGNIAGPYTVSSGGYPRQEGPAESVCSLTAEAIEEDGETVYKLTVEPYIGADDAYPYGHYMYSLSEEGPYQYENVFWGEPKSTYTAYVKYAAGGGYTESENGTPTKSVTTDEGKAKLPVIVCNEATPNESGEIHFSGTANVKIEYNGKIQNPNIYYTLDGTEPTAGSNLYAGPFDLTDIQDRVTIKAKVIKPEVASSDVATSILIKDGGNTPDDPNNPTNSSGISASAQPLTEATIANTKIQDMGLDGVKSGLASNLGGQGYTDNPQIKYFDLNVKVRDVAGGDWRDATAEDFAAYGNDGMPVEVKVADLQQAGIDLPADVSPTTHKFGMSHMFATDVGSNAAGTVEPISVSSGSNGTTIAFRVRGASPFAIAYQAGGSTPPSDDPNGGNGDDPNGGNGDDPNGGNGNDPNGNSQVNAYATDNPNGTGNGTTTGTSAGTQGASNDAANALSGIMPKTGDPLSFVPWIAAIVISVGAIAFFATRKKDKKKKTVKKTQAAKKKK